MEKTVCLSMASARFSFSRTVHAFRNVSAAPSRSASRAAVSPSRLFGLGEHAGDDDVEQVEHIILGAGFQCLDKRQERGDASLVRKAGNGLALAVPANRASATPLFWSGGLFEVDRWPASLSLPSLAIARPSSGMLCNVGPDRRRSSGLCSLPRKPSEAIRGGSVDPA